jgi:16S rRNA (adenine1518-N6/adenine1519-N6)-dimethyltransferase
MNTFPKKLAAKKSLGQHFLNNPHIPVQMAKAGGICKGDIVVEIGPGTGVLTKTLLDYGAYVIALETDARAVSLLHHTFSKEIKAKNIVILHTDVRSLDITSLGLTAGNYKVVSNIPYYLSGFLFRLFLEHDCFPSTIVFLVADRITHDPKESLLSLSVKVFGTPKYIQTVKKGNFSPTPKVDSAIIAISHIDHDAIRHIGIDFFFKTIHTGFKSKRKQLLGNLAEHYPRTVLETMYMKYGIPHDVRGEDLSLEKWLILCDALKRTQYDDM